MGCHCIQGGKDSSDMRRMLSCDMRDGNLEMLGLSATAYKVAKTPDMRRILSFGMGDGNLGILYSGMPRAYSEQTHI